MESERRSSVGSSVLFNFPIHCSSAPFIPYEIIFFPLVSLRISLLLPLHLPLLLLFVCVFARLFYSWENKVQENL